MGPDAGHVTPSPRLAPLLGLLLLGAACLSPVAELYCNGDAECPATAHCLLGQCLWPDGGLAPGLDAGVPDGGGGGGGGNPGTGGGTGTGGGRPGGGAGSGGGRPGTGGGGPGTGGGGPGDGGASTIGMPCSSTTQCGTAAFCIPASGFSGPTGFPGGSCLQVCASTAPCPGSSRCIDAALAGVASTVCFPTCPAPGSQSTCRAGYVCASASSSGYCRPDCNNGGLAACPSPLSCEPSGQCR
jgi:hypothetical protein